jgi:hypothetical protein
MFDVDLLVCSYSEDSHRHAILADDGLTGILYLHAPSDDPEKPGKVEATCFAYNRVDPIEAKDVQSYRPSPPPIVKGCASTEAVCAKPKAHRWELSWSINGEAVLLLRDEQAWAIVSLENRRGFTKAIAAHGPWGSPWSNDVFMATEWGGRTRPCA